MALPIRTMVKSGALGVPGKAFGAGGRGTLFPIFEAVVELPDLMVGPKSRIARVHERAARAALLKEMQFHHKKRIPEHFDRFKQKKYGYAPRSPRVQAVKKRAHLADLVKTKRTRARMKQSIRISFPRTGRAGGGIAIRGTLDFKVGFKDNRAAQQGVTPQVMKDEIARWTIREERTAAQHVLDTYVDELNKNLSKRARRQIGGQLAKMGT